jgi:glycosyltransferase involved in cell wall biosynthesis
MDGKYKSAHSLKENVSHLIDVGELDQALRLIHDFVELIFTEPLCTSQVFGSRDLDDLCQSIGKVNLAAIKHKNTDVGFSQHSQPIFAYVVTKLQKSGGHTRVIEDFINALPEAQHVILSTELTGRSDTEYLINGLAKHASIVLELAPKGNYQQRLTWLQKRLLEILPKKVYLFNHHQDSVAVAAIQPELNLDAYYYHHGDHHLCLGVYLSHLRHIDPHPMGYHNCRNALGIENIYVPLTIEDKGERPADLPFLQSSRLTTCTAARSNKIEITYFINYLDFVPKLLRVTGGTHVHIGRLTPWALFRIRRGLKRLGVPPDRFIYTPWVPSVWKALHDYRVDLYIASFPYGGGLTLIEAMGAGVPVVLHRHIFSSVLSGIDLAYPGVFSWRQPEELLDYCASITADELVMAGKSGREQFQRFHSIEHLHRFVNDDRQSCLVPIGIGGEFFVEADEWALWMERQLSFRRILNRIAYRAFRKFRARWL